MTDGRTDGRTDGQAQTNLPLNIFEVGAIETRADSCGCKIAGKAI